MTVIAPVATVQVNLSAQSVTVGSTVQAAVVLKDAAGNTLSGRTVVWTSSSQSVATVSAGGVVTGVTAGTSTITATVEGKTGSAAVTVIANPAGAFTLSFPSNRAANASTTPEFSWSSASGATSYTLEVATSDAFGTTDVINQTGITTNGFTPTTPLATGTVYFWRVAAVNSGGSTQASNGPREFSVPFSAGSDPSGIAITPDGTKMYVVNSTSSSTVTVVSLATKQKIATIPIGGFSAGQAAMRFDGQQVVAATNNSLAVIDVASNTVTKTIPMPCVATTLYGIAYTPDGTRIVLPDLSNGCTAEGVRIVTIASGASQFVDFNTGNVLIGIAVMPNGNSALVAGGPTGTSVRRLNLSTNAITSIPGTGGTYGVAISPDNSTAFVTGYSQTAIQRIDLGTNAASAGAATGSASGVAFTPDGTKAVVAADFNTYIVKVSDNSILATVPNGGSTVAITPDGKYALVSTGGGSGASGVVRIIRIP
ncbi:MAG TPA: Ig-like domain-containing protein [Vicinamibacterales bacterium]